MKAYRHLAWLALAGFLFGGLYLVSGKHGASYAEADTIADGAVSFRELEERFERLADEKGGEYAFEILRRAPLPPGTDLHLLGHVVGDKLYEQRGLDGIAVCTQEFRNACSHTIVIGALTEYGGEDALPLIRDACKKAPGGSGAYTMCYHGLGHGVFAFFGYDLESTAAFCKKTGTDEYGHREYAECVGGAVMELMGGGGHDPDAWLESRGRYLSSENPLSPCDAAWFPDETRTMCYMYLTPHLFEVAGADLAMPKEEHFSAAFGYCDRITASAAPLRDACFGGIGKEFPVLAMQRDIRDVARATDAQLGTMRKWCALAPHEEALRSCEHAVLDSLFWGGENDPRAAAGFCALGNGAEADRCFGDLTAMAEFYAPKGSPIRRAVCDAMPEAPRGQCRTILL